MKVLVACEFSGIVREAFKAKGHDAWSCDIINTEIEGNHLLCDVEEVLDKNWDLIIAHPPCTYLAVSGNKHYSNRPDLFLPAVDFAKRFFEFSDKVAVENPVGRLSSFWRKPDQYIQPWQFGHGETKKTGLWLKNLPILQSTNIVDGRETRVHKEPPSDNRWKNRSRTYRGVAEAMAEQWG